MDFNDLKNDLIKLSKVHEFHKNLNYCYSEKEVIDHLVMTLSELFEPGFIFLMTKHQEKFYFLILSALSEQDLPEYKEIFINEVETQFINFSLEKSEFQYSKFNYKRDHIQSYFDFPIMINNKRYGMLSIGHHEIGYLTGEDLELAQLLAENTAQRIKNIQLANEMKKKNLLFEETNRKLEKKLYQFSSLINISKEINGLHGIDDIKQMIKKYYEENIRFDVTFMKQDEAMERFPEFSEIFPSIEDKPFFVEENTQKTGDLLACIKLMSSKIKEFLILTSKKRSAFIEDDEREFLILLSQKVDQAFLTSIYLEDTMKASIESELKLTSFINLSKILDSIFNIKDLLENTVSLISRIMNVDICSIMLVEDGGLKIKAALGLSDDIIKNTYIKIGESISGWVAASGKEIYVENIEEDKRFNRQSIPKYYTPSLLSVPLKRKDKVIGVININNRADRNEFTERDINLLKTLSSTIALVIENNSYYKEHIEKEKIEQDLNNAWSIQNSYLPDKPPMAFKENIAAISIPAKYVGGDYYDFLDLDGNRLAVAIADVSGKGMPAALLMMLVRTIFRAVEINSLKANEVLIKINKLISEGLDPYKFVTMQYMEIDFDKKNIKFSNAGHEPVLFYNPRTQSVEEIRIKAIPLGIDDSFEYEERELEFEQGNVFLFYTDGITEAQSEEREFYGRERLKVNLAQFGHLSPEDILNRILTDVQKYSGKEQHDDITMVVVKI